MRGRPVYVWVIYTLGLLAAAVFLVSVLFTAGAYLASDDDVGISWNVSTPAIVVWGGLIVLAVATWLRRRRQVRR